jgi:hypothetical protein
VTTDAFACTGVPELVVGARFFFALAAAVIGVPEETISAVAGEAAALAVLSLVVHEPEFTGRAKLWSALVSAASGVPVRVFGDDGIYWVGWSAQTLAAVVVPVFEGIAVVRSCGFLADALAVFIIPELVITALFSLALAVTVIFGPSEASWALFGLASAPALGLVEDLVVTANLVSADAAGSRLVVNAEWVLAYSADWDTCAVFSAPVVVSTSAQAVGLGVGAFAIAIVATPEFVVFAWLLVADALSDLEVKVFSFFADSWGKNTRTGSVRAGVPDVSVSTRLGLLFAAAVDCVEEPSAWAKVSWAASALAGGKVPDKVAFALLRRASACAQGSVPVLIGIASLGFGVANAAAFFSRPEGVNLGSANVWRPIVALACWFKAVALAANVVEDIIVRADLG